MTTAPAFDLLRTLRYLAARATPWRSTVVATSRSGLRFRCHARDVVGRRILRTGELDPVPTPLVRSLVEAGLAEAPIAAIKMDVEGFESEAIAGGGETLRRAGLLAIEINPPLCPGGPEANIAMLDEIEASGLRPHWCDDPDQEPTMDAIKSRTTACDVIFRRA